MSEDLTPAADAAAIEVPAADAPAVEAPAEVLVPDVSGLSPIASDPSDGDQAKSDEQQADEQQAVPEASEPGADNFVSADPYTPEPLAEGMATKEVSHPAEASQILAGEKGISSALLDEIEQRKAVSDLDILIAALRFELDKLLGKSDGK